MDAFIHGLIVAAVIWAAGAAALALAFWAFIKLVADGDK